MNEIGSNTGKRLSAAVRWILERPLFVVLIAHSLFSIGIWNARDGYGEETSPVIYATMVLQGQRSDPSLYVNLIALTLRYLTADPVGALTFVKYLSSLLATIALCLTLNCFTPLLRRSGIMFACFVWIASSLNAPFLQSSSLSLFTFAIMLLGVNCLLRSESLPGLVGFYVLGVAAALMRPEYYLPVVLVSLPVAGVLIYRVSSAVESRYGLARYWSCGLALLLFVGGGVAIMRNPPAALEKKLASIDQYALFGFGQCYADFYRRSHPEEIFDPMTEYETILNRNFGEPESLVSAIKNNPGEALNYFFRNTAGNLFHYFPRAMFERFRDQSEEVDKRFSRLVHNFYFLAGVALAFRLFQRRVIFSGLIQKLKAGLARPRSLTRKLLLLLVLVSTSSVAIIMLVGTPRYFLPWVPLFYLGVAYSANALFSLFRMVRFEAWLLPVAGLFYCRPNYLKARPNYEMDAVQQVGVHVRDRPRIAAWWADPNVALGFGGNAVAVNSSDGINQADIENGHIDILMVDGNLRGTRTWTSQKEFFGSFEEQPEKYGFKKLVDHPSGRFDVYYRPDDQ